MRIETLSVRAGCEPDAATGAIIPPIHLSTTFERAPDGSFPSGNIYSRQGNPNRLALEKILAELEGGTVSISFPSGMAAIIAVFSALEPGDHVIAPVDAYFGTGILLREHFSRTGLRSSFADMTDLDAVSAAITPETKLIWIETPSNPLISITDIEGVVKIAKEAGAKVVCDNTWATPLLQRPLDLGADMVMHSTTKYLSGHCDVMGGAIVAKEDGPLVERIRFMQKVGGAIPSPFDCWLVVRGIRTMPCRVRVHCENAKVVARFLDGHEKVERVHFPGLPGDPGHPVAARQMNDFGGMLSFVVDGGRDRAFAVAAGLRIFTRATSLGGPESLIEHRASIEGDDSTTPEGLLRCSIGLEHPDDLIEDLDRALRS